MRKRIIAALLSLAMTSSVFCTLPSANAQNLKGDVKSDGVIDVTDVSYLSLYLIGDIEFSDDLKKVADVDCDGEVRLTDLAMIRQFVSKKIDSLGGILSDEPDDSELTDITADSKTIIVGGDFSNRYITGKSLMISSMDAYDKYIGIDTEENENIAKQGIEVSDEFFKKNRLAVMVDNSEGCNGVDFKLTAVKLDKKDNVHLYYDKKVPDLMTALGNITHYITVVLASDNKETEDHNRQKSREYRRFRHSFRKCHRIR